MDVKKGDWVQVSKVVLEPEERAPQLPEDTRKVPLLLWVKGYALHDSNMGDIVEIETVSFRRVKGALTAIRPVYTHGFGEYVPELAVVREQVKKMCFQEEF